MSKATIKARAAIKKRREQLAFDKLPAEEKEKRKRAGLDPYEPEQIRAKKKAAELEKRKKYFDKLPKEARDALTALGVSPHQGDGVKIRRTCGALSVKEK